MSKLTAAILAGALALIVAGGVLIAVWGVAPPSAEIEKVLPDERFPR